MPGITIRTRKSESVGPINTCQDIEISVNGVSAENACLDFTKVSMNLAPEEIVTVVGEVLVDSLNVENVNGRLECEIAGERCVIVPIREIEERAGHAMFARAFKKILGLA